ncbi:probable serine/threonine-protein kinase MARK-A [Drosophila obscura]|uniref:probable serine/threonine-protein kinase MARK-A n=1 Tax=Drosophila obscura TaxID=7282 RepID=UPI001BB11900|nr:probable serine/threonine-protein kinase MARK-A [Drosophila obscura]
MPVATLQEVLVPSNNTSSPPVYRVSRPAPKQPEKRVPTHLQDIMPHPGYVDDDAGDVIRIIEPPQHFQQLKRLRQRQPLGTPAVVWEQPRKLSSNRTPAQPRPQLPTGDLLTQETQNMPLANSKSNSNSNSNNLQLPMEILASVRKTERLLHRQRQKQLPLGMRQRHIQRQSHTLIAQKSMEQQLYQRGQQQRLRAVLSRNQQEHKRSKRMKRETQSAKGSGAYDVQQGLKLVAHIGDLLRNATLYLPDDGEAERTKQPNEVKKSTACSGNATTNCDSRRRRQRLFKPTKTAEKQRERLRERRRNFRNEATSTTTTTTTKQPETTTTTKTTVKSAATAATAAALSGNSTTSATPLASRLVNSRKSPNNNKRNGGSVARSDDSILYADIMTNIRQLWQEQDELLGAAPPQFIAPGQVPNNTDYRALDVYLKELAELSKRLPTVAPITGLNREELERVTPTPSWYLINHEGKIYETRLDSETKPSSTLFHRFPDMPNGDDSVDSTLDLE